MIESNPESILQQIVKTKKDKQKLVITSPEERITYESLVVIRPNNSEPTNRILGSQPSKKHEGSSPMSIVIAYDPELRRVAVKET